MIHRWITWTLLLFIFKYAKSSSNLDVQKQILDNLLSDKYDPDIRPEGANGTGPVEVEVNIYVRSLSDIDEAKTEYNAQLTYRESWVDSRLKYDDRRFKYLTLIGSGKIWKPDIFFSNEKTGQFHKIVMPNDLIRIFPDGRVLHSTRVSLKLSCPMDLRRFPLDNQICSIIMASYAYTTDDLIIIWKEESGVQLTKNLHLQYTLNEFSTDYCKSRTNTGEYGCVRIDFHFSRDIHTYIIHNYIPSITLVIYSWIPFWLNTRAKYSRLAISLAMLLSHFFQLSGSKYQHPPTSYTKAIEVWTGVCLTFLFFALIEVCFTSNAVDDDDKHGSVDEFGDTSIEKQRNAMIIDENQKEIQIRILTQALRWFNRFPTRAEKIDAVCRFAFPAAFAFFNLVYWLSYMRR